MLDQQVILSINKAFELEASVEITEEAFLIALSEHLCNLLNTRTEYLFHLLYRLDIDENFVRNFLFNNSNKDACMPLAINILERHKKKLETKERYKKNNPEKEW